MFSLLRRILTFHWLTTLLLMALFGLVFGLTTLNLFVLVQANFSLIARHGVMALLDGGLLQLAELTGYGLAAIVCYVLIKACEHGLVERIFAGGPPHVDDGVDHAPRDGSSGDNAPVVVLRAKRPRRRPVIYRQIGAAPKT